MYVRYIRMPLFAFTQDKPHFEQVSINHSGCSFGMHMPRNPARFADEVFIRFRVAPYGRRQKICLGILEPPLHVDIEMVHVMQGWDKRKPIQLDPVASPCKSTVGLGEMKGSLAQLLSHIPRNPNPAGIKDLKEHRCS